MAFLDSFKKNNKTYLVLISIGFVVVIFNNIIQFLSYMVSDKRLALLSITSFIIVIIYAFRNKEEVLK